MKKILITPSVRNFKKKNLIFNLEKNWFDYSKKLNFVIEIIDYNNFKKQIKNADGIIFSGGNGNDLYRYKKTYKNKFREYNEKKILSFVKKKKKIPKLFVCYGFQLLASSLASRLAKSNLHVKRTQSITYQHNKMKVNSYHTIIIKTMPKSYSSCLYQKDSSIEIAEEKKNKILCLMFHPERFNCSQTLIDKKIKNFFNLK